MTLGKTNSLRGFFSSKQKEIIPNNQNPNLIIDTDDVLKELTHGEKTMF